MQEETARTRRAIDTAMDKTAFVFAGGGSLGAIQVGMLRELVAWGVTPDIVIGASAGAINGAYFACNPGVAGAGRLDQLWRGIRRADIMPWGWRSVFGMVGRSRGHLVPGPYGWLSRRRRRGRRHRPPRAASADPPGCPVRPPRWCR